MFQYASFSRSINLMKFVSVRFWLMYIRLWKTFIEALPAVLSSGYVQSLRVVGFFIEHPTGKKFSKMLIEIWRMFVKCAPCLLAATLSRLLAAASSQSQTPGTGENSDQLLFDCFNVGEKYRFDIDFLWISVISRQVCWKCIICFILFCGESNLKSVVLHSSHDMEIVRVTSV